jgi:hypothetical protein
MTFVHALIISFMCLVLAVIIMAWLIFAIYKTLDACFGNESRPIAATLWVIALVGSVVFMCALDLYARTHP